MPAVGLGKVFMSQDTTCRGRLRQVDSPLLEFRPWSDMADVPVAEIAPTRLVGEQAFEVCYEIVDGIADQRLPYRVLREGVSSPPALRQLDVYQHLPTRSPRNRLLRLGLLLQCRQGVKGACLQIEPSSCGFPTVHARGCHAERFSELRYRQSELSTQPGH